MFAGGGTGGHLFPAIAIADEVRRLEPSANILFVGTKDKLEARVVPKHGYGFRTIWISGFKRGFHLSNLLFPLKLLIGMYQAHSIIAKFKPDVVIGTGGYVSGPVLRAAMMRGIPTIIQEQNSFPGVTTRILAMKANEVHVSFPGSGDFFKRKDNVILSGNPTRSDLEHADRGEALRYFGFDAAPKKTLLVFGGSLGAHSINVAVLSNLEQLMKTGLRLIWQTGEQDLAAAQQAGGIYPRNDIWVGAFLDRMDYAYAVSDLVVCRAGATTIAEITRLGKAALLIPYPHAAANHQAENASALKAEGAAEVLDDKMASHDLLNRVVSMLDEGRLNEIGKNSKSLGKPNAASDIAKRAIALAARN